MRLIDLRPVFLDDSAGRKGTALATEECPCGCGEGMCIPLRNPLDGGPPLPEQHSWANTGNTFETLTLEPSIKRLGCGWHGFIRNGEIVSA